MVKSVRHRTSQKILAPFTTSKTTTSRTAAESPSRIVVTGFMGAKLDLRNSKTTYPGLFAGLSQAYAASLYPFLDAPQNACSYVDPTNPFYLMVL